MPQHFPAPTPTARCAVPTNCSPHDSGGAIYIGVLEGKPNVDVILAAPPHLVYALRRLIAEHKKRTREAYPFNPNANPGPNLKPNLHTSQPLLPTRYAVLPHCSPHDDGIATCIAGVTDVAKPTQSRAWCAGVGLGSLRVHLLKLHPQPGYFVDNVALAVEHKDGRAHEGVIECHRRPEPPSGQ